MYKLFIKRFDELSTMELYQLIKARIEVFVVEQKITVQELDDDDFISHHLYYYDESGKVMATLRMYPMRNEEKTIHIGRVLTINHGLGLGREMMKEAIHYAFDVLSYNCIYVEAQVQAIGYYEKMGFKVCSDEFMDAGIPHKQMRLYKNEK